jgi:hypothetical protein
VSKCSERGQLQRELTSLSKRGIGNNDVVPVIIIDLDVFLVRRIYNIADLDIGCLLGRQGRRLIDETTVSQDVCISPFGLIGNLLTRAFPLERKGRLVVLAV